MLVLSRKANETILIGKDIEISVLSIEGDRVRLGLSAPKNMRIFRQELIKEVRDVNFEATRAAGTAPLAAPLGQAVMEAAQSKDDSKEAAKAPDNGE